MGEVIDASDRLSRTERQYERRRAQNQRRLLALGGIAVMAGALGATVGVLDVIH
jgi:hypothetical protein